MNPRSSFHVIFWKSKKKKKNLNSFFASAENVLRENTIKSQYEGRISNLERELEEARQNATAASVGDMKQVLERLQKENAELQAKVSFQIFVRCSFFFFFFEISFRCII